MVYIMGAGRSGSTILGVLLGNAANAFYAGELDQYGRTGGVPSGEGEGLTRFWGSVAESLRARGARFDPRWHGWFEHPRGLLGRRLRARGERGRYRGANAALYHSLARLTGADVIVDSSHYPLRRWALRRLPGVDFLTVHLVRDPRAVVRSLQTDLSPKKLLAANGYLWATHLLSELVYRLLRGNRLRLRYEDITTDPHRVLERVGRSAGLDIAAVDVTALRTGPVFAGNRLIKQATVRLDPVRPAAPALPPDRVSRVVQAPWLWRYGYLADRGPGSAAD